MSNDERKSGDAAGEGDLREQLGVLGEDLRVLGRRVKELAARQMHAAGDRASAVADDLGECVRDRPLQSLLTAAGIGVLAGILLGRR